MVAIQGNGLFNFNQGADNVFRDHVYSGLHASRDNCRGKKP